jgi:hypothetical protein
MLNGWGKCVEDPWSSVHDEWTSARERLTSARWESEVKTVKSNLSTTTAKFDAGLTSLALLRRRRQHRRQEWGGHEWGFS